MPDDPSTQHEKPEYEAPGLESLGAAEELAKGNEGSQTDDVISPAG
jgi:hypothetical protein